MKIILWSLTILIALQSDKCGDAEAAKPVSTPALIPRIKCEPTYRNGDIADWNCVDLPSDCAVDRKKLPKRPGIEGGGNE